jgi:hypothetical protein
MDVESHRVDRLWITCGQLFSRNFPDLSTSYPQWHLYNTGLSTAYTQSYAQVIHSKFKVIHKLSTMYTLYTVSYPQLINSVYSEIPLYTVYRDLTVDYSV